MLKEYTVKNVKKYLKKLSNKISIVKQLRKLKRNQDLRGFNEELINLVIKDIELGYCIEDTLRIYRRHFRHHHIAYCEFRGRSRDEIEKPAEDNRPNEKDIKLIKEKMTKAMEAVRDERKTLRAG